MHHGVGVGIVGVDAECLRQPGAIAGLDRGEAEAPLHVARGDEADPARAEHADAVVEDHVVIRPWVGHARSIFLVIARSSATKQSSLACGFLDCFVATLLAMTISSPVPTIPRHRFFTGFAPGIFNARSSS